MEPRSALGVDNGTPLLTALRVYDEWARQRLSALACRFTSFGASATKPQGSTRDNDKAAGKVGSVHRWRPLQLCS